MYYSVNGYDFKPTFSTFPGGEEYVRTQEAQHPVGNDGLVVIHAKLRSSQNIMQLLMLNDALRRLRPEAEFVLDMTYLPYARQDRVCRKGESFSLKVFCDLINSMSFDRVLVVDCHSMVGTALLDNVIELTQLDALRDSTESCYMAFKHIDAIVSPDAGATKKAQEIADYLNLPVIQCLKQRTDAGIKIKVCEDVTGLNLLVVDDIIDGGGTFVALAEALENSKSKELFATYGIFSKGKEQLNKLYHKIHTYEDWTE